MTEQDAIAVLASIKSTIGRRYKSMIRAAWESGNYGPLYQWQNSLQQMRNSFGPHWLTSIRVK